MNKTFIKGDPANNKGVIANRSCGVACCKNASDEREIINIMFLINFVSELHNKLQRKCKNVNLHFNDKL